MSLDPTIRQQTYQYFRQEAPELLRAIEEGLFNLRKNWGINQVNNLMRATHTLKGASTSVGLETIAQIAHSLEDIFKALCKPNLSLDPEVEALLFEGLECLRLPLMAELNGSTINDTEVLNQTAFVFALLQDKLGDCFDQEPYLPTSADLGFDLAQSMFELGVAQRLEQIAAMLNETEPEAVKAELQTHAEVLLGLAESLNLSGFAAIARATIAALTYYPEQAIRIAQAALADFQAGQAAVLAGDRTQGGEPSSTLQQLAMPPALDGAENLLEEPSSGLLESIWGSATEPASTGESLSQAGTIALQSASLTPDPLLSEPTTSPLKEPAHKDSSSALPTVRVAVKHLDRFNHAVGELVTHQNRQSLQTEQLQRVSKTLLSQVKRHQQLFTQLQDHTHREANHQQRTQAKNPPSVPPSLSSKSASRSRKRRRNRFDRSGYLNSADLIRSLLDQTVQFSETAEAIYLLTEQTSQLLEKQHQLLTNTQDALIEARMLPLSEIFDRFPRMLQQLETLHNKPVALKLEGGEVLVDKAVAEKLFDPLLHLLRNAFAHGIEPPTLRRQQGKPERGLITFSAYYHGRNLVIEVQDDGSGLNFDQIRQRAVERQFLSIEQVNHLSPEQLTEILFEPGFSTATQVSDLSGRGVGLDVVKNQLTALQGKATVQSEPHRGTTFMLQIPLNLTIAQLFVCEADGKTYALLDDPIEQILIPSSSQIQERNGGKFLRWFHNQTEALIPIYSIVEALDYEAPTPAFSSPSSLASKNFISHESAKPVILIRRQGELLGLEVDRLTSEQKLVIRPLGSMIHPPKYVQGAATLADGRLALVIDAATLLERIVMDAQESSLLSGWTHALPEQGLTERLLPFAPAVATSELRASPNTGILVVEDSITTRQSLVLTLEKAGYQVLQAQDGREGLDCFQQQPNIRLVICDVEMPRMNGFEFLRHRQQIPALASVPVLILSSRSDDKHRMLASQLGATVYMVKPFMEHKLIKMVTTLLAHVA
ncbi:hybrid sensor histidine kinase/response regulator [Leptolyngbya ohadii]|uniref:hybrid sensor histidine kinase/response regulator n=1 Tax=Leptolyngbya ohadii TaxID=1962290 RepID=UPI000B59EE18|nr:hybrid sensor histidine kinase/response regulator [Leptolyngbya ohadii]